MKLFPSMMGWVASLGLLASTAALAEVSRVPITYRETSGTRPYVPVVLNGHPLLFMLHAAADSTAMTTHANAAAAGITQLIGKQTFGITGVGQVSPLGRANAFAGSFAVGGRVLHNVPLQVFEIPQTPPVDGMLGILWLRETGAFVDFRHDQLVVPASANDADAERAALRHQGYVAHPMTWDPSVFQYLVHPSINGAPATTTVSTVAEDTLDEVFARAQGIELVQRDETFGGPTGTTGHVYGTKSPYTFSLDGTSFHTGTATVFDTYAYEAKPRPPAAANATMGSIGCNFMRANQAVIDFGSGTLYLPERTG